MKIVFIQARTGSSRLPGKILKQVLSKPILMHQIDRIRRAKTIDKIVVITSTLKNDDVIEELCNVNSINCYRGSETDLLDRHYQASKLYKAKLIVKVPSDCPLIDPYIIDEVVNLWINNKDKYDYVSNYHPPTFPDGMDVEACTFNVLEIAWKNATLPMQREHTFPYIWDNPQLFKIGNILNGNNNMFMTHRWTLDYDEDFIFINKIFEEFKDNINFNMNDILNLINKKPWLSKINEMYLGVNWYRNHNKELKTIENNQYRQIDN